MKKKQKIIIGFIISLILIIFLFLNQLVILLSDFQWFKDLGFSTVFTKKIVVQLQVGGPVFLILSFLSYFYLTALKKSYYDKIQSYHLSVSEGMINKMIAIPSIVMG